MKWYEKYPENGIFMGRAKTKKKRRWIVENYRTISTGDKDINGFPIYTHDWVIVKACKSLNVAMEMARDQDSLNRWIHDNWRVRDYITGNILPLELM